MDKPDGRKQTVPGFHSEHEADAWIVQAKRMIRDAGPWTPLAPRKPPTVVAPAPQPALQATEAPATGGGDDAAAASRVRVRPARERSTARG
jgi:hypothetical protein